jgi:hypothetical protein
MYCWLYFRLESILKSKLAAALLLISGLFWCHGNFMASLTKHFIGPGSMEQPRNQSSSLVAVQSYWISIPFCTSNHLSDTFPSLLCSLFSWLFRLLELFRLMERFARNDSNPAFWHQQASRLCSIHICGLFQIFLFSSINNSVYFNMNISYYESLNVCMGILLCALNISGDLENRSEVVVNLFCFHNPISDTLRWSR